MQLSDLCNKIMHKICADALQKKVHMHVCNSVIIVFKDRILTVDNSCAEICAAMATEMQLLKQLALCMKGQGTACNVSEMTSQQ